MVRLGFYNLFAEDLRLADPNSQSHTTKSVIKANSSECLSGIWRNKGELFPTVEFCAAN